MTATTEMLEQFKKGIESFQHTSFSLDPREDFEGDHCSATAVYRENGDIVFQLFPVKPWGTGESARALVTDLVETYFGSTDHFAAAPTPELDSWAVKAIGLANKVGYTREHHVVGFLLFINIFLADPV